MQFLVYHCLRNRVGSVGEAGLVCRIDGILSGEDKGRVLDKHEYINFPFFFDTQLLRLTTHISGRKCSISVLDYLKPCYAHKSTQ